MKYVIDYADLSVEPIEKPDIKAVENSCPIHTLGHLRKVLKDFSDDTVISCALAPMTKLGVDVKDQHYQKRAHRILSIVKGTLKNKRTFISFVSGEDITDKLVIRGLVIKDDISTGNKENSH